MSAKKYNYQDNFEMLMVRHEYLGKVDNPDPIWITKFASIVNRTAALMYEKLQPNFGKVGYDLEDVQAIANCYMVGYMGIYSLERNNANRKKAIDSFKRRFKREPTQRDIDKKERTNLIGFLRQKIQHSSVVCARKARNITVGCDKNTNFAFTVDSQPASKEMIMKHGIELGYRPINKTELKDIKLKAKQSKTKKLTDEFGFGILQLQVLNIGIKEYDYKCLFIDEKQRLFHASPEDVLLNKAEVVQMSYFKEIFKKMDNKEKKSTLTSFIKMYRGNPEYKVELKTARKMLRDI